MVAAALYVIQGLPSVDLIESKVTGGLVAYHYRDYQSGDSDRLGVEGPAKGPVVKLDTLPAYVPNAFIAIEDKRFYSNGGVDLQGMLRAVAMDIKAMRAAQGGSTITQQVVKNTLFGPKDHTIRRKIQEFLLASQLARKFKDNKNHILELYFTVIEYARNSFGIEAAAKTYFGKQAKDLTLAEAAMLAGAANAPACYDPRKAHPDPKHCRAHPVPDPETCERAKLDGGAPLPDGYDLAWGRAKVVLCAMREQKLIDRAAYDDALAHQPIIGQPTAGAGVVPERGNNQNWLFAGNRARLSAALEGKSPIEYAIGNNTTLHVTLSLDRQAQKLAEEVVAEKLRPYTARGIQAVLIAADGQGAVRAFMGADHYVNTPGYGEEPLQIGSVFKAFVYAAAMQNGARPGDWCDDVKGAIPVSNHDGYHGPQALVVNNYAFSSNVAAVRMAREVGAERVVNLARDFGLYRSGRTKPPGTGYAAWPLSTSATPLDVAEAFLPFANGGHAASLHFIDQIADTAPRSLVPPPAPGPQVISPAALASMHKLMWAVVNQPGATGLKAAAPGLWFAGKTGTTNLPHDEGERGRTAHVWFAGYARDLVLVVWVGQIHNKPLPPEIAVSSFAASIAGEFMRRQKLNWGVPPQEWSPDPVQASEAAYIGPGTPPSGEGCRSGAELPSPPNPGPAQSKPQSVPTAAQRRPQAGAPKKPR